MFVDNKVDPMLAAQELKAIADAESSPPSEPSSYISSGLESDHSDSSFFTIHTSAAPGLQNGKGAFASRDIQRGDLILSEKPIFSVPNNAPEPRRHIFIEAAVRKLSPTHLNEYLSLHNSHNKCSCSFRPLPGIFSTNGFGVSDSEGPAGGICLRASRFNHSCSPNARFSFNSNTGDLRIYAVGTIPRGEEIFVGYIDHSLLGKPLYGSPRRLRQAALHTHLHFTCECSACSLSEAEAEMSDARRHRINAILESFRGLTLALIRSQGVQILNDVVEAVHLLQEEGYLSDADDFTDEAGPICAFHSDWVSSSYWADLTYHTKVAEFGEDSPQVAQVSKMYLNPKSFTIAGLGPPKDLTGIRV